MTDLGDELVLMQPHSSEMFSLNAAGRLIWQGLPGSAAQLTALLVDRYGLPAAEAHGDVMAVLEELKAQHLVTGG